MQEQESDRSARIRPAWWRKAQKYAATRSVEKRLASKHGTFNVWSFVVYETVARLYVIGSDELGQRFKVIKLDRDIAAAHFKDIVVEDPHTYSAKEAYDLVQTIDSANSGKGDLVPDEKGAHSWGRAICSRPHYLVIATKRFLQGELAGHKIYGIAGTSIIPIFVRRGGAKEAREAGNFWQNTARPEFIKHEPDPNAAP